MSVYPSVFALLSLQETRAWVKENPLDWGLVVRRPFVSATIVVRIGEIRVATGVGFAKCAAGDVWDESVGIKIARGRAEKDAAQQVYKHTLGYEMDGVRQALTAWAKAVEHDWIKFVGAMKPLVDMFRPFVEAFGNGETSGELEE